MLEWFTTIPGILVICGVILLIIAIILFALGNKKQKAEIVANEQVNDNTKSVDEVQFVATPEVQGVPEVVNSQVQEQPEVNNDVVTSTDTIVEPVVEPVLESVANEITDIPSVTEEQSVSEVTIPTVEPVINIPEMNINQPTTVYGGQEPVVEFSVEEKPVTIYGGNDPLEATQKLPLVEDNHIPYGGEFPEIKISDAVVQPVIEPVTAIPSVDFNSISQPEVVNIPDVADTVSNQPVSIETEAVQPVVEDNNISTVEEL